MLSSPSLLAALQTEFVLVFLSPSSDFPLWFHSLVSWPWGVWLLILLDVLPLPPDFPYLFPSGNQLGKGHLPPNVTYPPPPPPTIFFSFPTSFLHRFPSPPPCFMGYSPKPVRVLTKFDDLVASPFLLETFFPFRSIV